MNDHKKALVKLIVSLAVIVIGSSCVVVCYALHAGQERMVFSVKSNNGLNEKVYLKTNGDVVVLSRSPKTRMITEQDNFFTLHEESILYKDTTDTLYIIMRASFMSDSSEMIPSPNDIAIKYIYERKYRHELISYYTARGFSIFPSTGYL